RRGSLRRRAARGRLHAPRRPGPLGDDGGGGGGDGGFPVGLFGGPGWGVPVGTIPCRPRGGMRVPTPSVSGAASGCYEAPGKATQPERSPFSRELRRRRRGDGFRRVRGVGE